jgi:hypothetical protein
VREQLVKTQLLIKTPSAGTVRVIPCYLGVDELVVLEYFDEVTMAQQDAAEHYLFDEGFIEFAEGKNGLERL